MTVKTQQTIRFICKRYQFQALDEDMLQKIVYVCDWVSTLKLKHQITEARWFLGETGPQSPDVRIQIHTDPMLRKERFDFVTLVRISTLHLLSKVAPSLSEEERRIIDTVVSSSKDMYAGDFLRLVAATYEYSSVQGVGMYQLNLDEVVEDFRKVRQWFHTSPSSVPIQQEFALS